MDDKEKKVNKRKSINRKNKEFFLPLPPKAMTLLTEHIRGLDEEDPLLYGLKGRPLENKQMNYITNKICEHLNWLENTEETTEDNNQKSEKYFSPHAFRYSISTLFSEMGVPKDTIKFLLITFKKRFRFFRALYFKC